MFKSDELTKHLCHKLAVLELNLRNLKSLTLYDGAIFSETFFQIFLSELYDLNLEDLNKTDKNAAAIDLSDKNKRISIQVTLTSTPAKVNDTVRKFISHDRQKDYSELWVLFLQQKQKTYKVDSALASLGVTHKILDFSDLITELRGKRAPKLARLIEIMDEELNGADFQQHQDYENRHKLEQKTDQEALEEISDYLFHPALRDLYVRERSFDNMQKRLDDFIALIHDGKWQGEYVVKPRKRFERQRARQLKAVADSISDFRGFVTELAKTNQLDLVSGQTNFRDGRMPQILDDKKRDIQQKINDVLINAGLPPLNW